MATDYREATAYEQDRRGRRRKVATVCRNTTLAPRNALDLRCLAPSLDSSTVYVLLQPSWILTLLNLA